MEKDKNIERQIEDAFNSIKGINKATPKPYLLTRINARLNSPVKNNWESAAVFISRPSVMALGLCLVLAVNVGVMLLNTSSTNKPVAERSATITDEDESSATFVSIDNIENP